ncbi:MAG: hypothetical protein V1921_03870 [Candidatus Altiarchaeota archaeon]
MRGSLMKQFQSSKGINPVNLRNYYNLMQDSFECVSLGGSRNLSKAEINACYDWRVANMVIKDTLEPKSSFSYDEWESFAYSCSRGAGLSGINAQKIKDSIKTLYSHMMKVSNDMWKSSEERRRHNDALERLNRFLTVDMYSAETLYVPRRK